MLDFKVTGLDEAIRKIRDFKVTLEDKMKEVVEKLALEGYEVAGYAYETAFYAGTKDYQMIQPTWEGEFLTFYAEGEKIGFIEFGTGTRYEEHPKKYPGRGGGDPYTILGMDRRGEFGKGKGKNPPWTYVGDPGNFGTVISKKKDGSVVVMTSGNPPAQGMYNAAKVMTNKYIIAKMAKEVFSS